MAKYNLYKFLTETLTTRFRRGMKLPKKGNQGLDKHVITLMYRDHPDMFHMMDSLVLFDEFQQMRTSNYALFPETVELLDMLPL